jgi:hypothetical protein
MIASLLFGWGTSRRPRDNSLVAVGALGEGVIISNIHGSIHHCDARSVRSM